MRTIVLSGLALMAQLAFGGIGRQATFELDRSVLPRSGETLVLPSFDGTTESVTLKTRRISTTGVITFSGRTPGAVTDDVSVTQTRSGLVVRVDAGRTVRSYRVSDRSVTVRESAKAKGGRCAADDLVARQSVRSMAPAVTGSGERDPLVDGAALMRRGETVTNVIDVLIAVDRSAGDWIREKSDFAEEDDPVLYFAEDAITRCNATYANTDLDRFFTFNLAGVIEIASDCSKLRTQGYVDSSQLLEDMFDKKGLFKADWQRVAEKRETTCADLVSLLVSCGSEVIEGIVGIGYSLNTSTIRDPSFSDMSGNVCLIESVASGTTLAHELGHNMGAGHAEMADTSNSGPQLYDYSTGWYFNVTNAEGRVFMHATTVMGYNCDGYDEEHAEEWGEPPEDVDNWGNWVSGYFTGTEFFSSSVHTFKYRSPETGELVETGIPLGDAKHDNTRLLSKVYPVVSNFRVRKSTLTVVDPVGGALSLAGTGAYANGATVTLKATAAADYAFAGWYRSYDETTGVFSDPVKPTDGADYRNLSVKVAIPAEGTTATFVYARFLLKSEASEGVRLDQQDEVFSVDGGLPIAPIALSVTSDVLPKLAVSGLPAGLKFDAKTSSIVGTPTKAGRFTVKASITSAVLSKPVERFFTIDVRDFELSVESAGNGTVKGAGRYLAAKKVTLGATAAKGFVFAGWYDETEEPLVGTVDFRTASFPLVMTNADLRVTARFASIEDDTDSLAIQTEASYVTEADGSFALTVPVASLSLPKLSLKGLPSGLKFDAKLNRISGRTAKPGVYTVTVSATNLSVKKALAKAFTLTVPNIRSTAFMGLEYGTDAYPMSAGVAFNPAMIDLGTAEGWTLSAMAGLPSGLKFNAKTGELAGVPTKAGTFTVTLTAKNGKATSSATVTLAVEPLPAWAYGTFDGATIDDLGATDGLVSLTVSATGKISGKLQRDGLVWTLSAASFRNLARGVDVAHDAYLADLIGKSGKQAFTNELIVCAEAMPLESGLTRGRAEMAATETCDTVFETWQNFWKQEPYKTRGKAFGGKTFEFADGLVVKTAASGAATVSGRFQTGEDAAGKPIVYSATCSSVLIPEDETTYRVHCYFPPKSGKFDGYADERKLRWDPENARWSQTE